MRRVWKIGAKGLRIVWAAPNSLIGISVGVLGLLTGGRVRRHGPILEFYGGAVAWLLEHATLLSGGAIAMTLGHVVLGRSVAALDLAYEHELVHVRQYERWGPIFIPAYLLASGVLWLRGQDAYRQNPFEEEAYESDRRRREAG